MLTYTSYIKVQYYETDKMGVVHHSNYIRYFETARGEMMDAMGAPYTQTEAAGIMMPVRSVECTYLAPAYYGDTLRVETTVREVPRSRMTFDYELFNEHGTLLVTGRAVLAFIHVSTRKPTRAPQFVVQIVEKLLYSQVKLSL